MPETLSQDCLEKELEILKSKNLFRSLPCVSKSAIDFASNDYLGLTRNPRVCQKAAQALSRYGSGSGASRLISGNLKIHEELEKKLASFKREEAALIFSSGYLANLGALTTLVNEEDVIVVDRLSHASLVDAARLSKAKLWVFPHNDRQGLRDILSRAKRFRRRLVVTEAYFSMDGDVAPLVDLLEICEASDAILMVDEAHSTGVFGREGRGLTHQLGLEGKIPVVMGTLSKALASSGGFISGSSLLKEVLINRARSFIYTTAPTPASSAAALAALEWIEKNPLQIKNFWKRIDGTRALLQEAGFDLMNSVGPILPILIGQTQKTLLFQKELSREGFWVAAVRPPTVPHQRDRLRISLKATHSMTQLKDLVQALIKIRDKNQ